MFKYFPAQLEALSNHQIASAVHLIVKAYVGTVGALVLKFHNPIPQSHFIYILLA